MIYNLYFLPFVSYFYNNKYISFSFKRETDISSYISSKQEDIKSICEYLLDNNFIDYKYNYGNDNIKITLYLDNNELNQIKKKFIIKNQNDENLLICSKKEIDNFEYFLGLELINYEFYDKY